MKIDRNLNLVTRYENDEGDTVFIHSAPLSKDIFREHFVILSKTYSALFGEGLGIIAGPRMAYLMLEQTAKDADLWDGKNGVKNTLITQIINGCSALHAEVEKGWVVTPLEEAIKRGIVDVDEVLGEVVFFICICGVNRKDQVANILRAVSGLWGSSVTSLNATEYASSLKTLEPDETTEESLVKKNEQDGVKELSIPS